MMYKIRFLTLLAVLTCLVGALRASETSDKFARWLPNMAVEDINARKEAQQNWQNLCLTGGADPALRAEVNKLMVEQLAKENPVETTVWLLRQLGFTGDDSVVPTIEKFLKNKEIRIADEAARALAILSGDKASDRDILKKTGNETKMPMAIPYASDAAVAEWMKGYEKQSDFEKAQTIANLTKRRDGNYMPQVLDAAKSEDENLRDAGILALGVLGSSREIPVLLEQAFDGKNKDLAKTVLSQMIDRMLDARLLGLLEQEQDAGRFEVLADVLSRRYNAATKPIILNRAASADCPNRLALIRIAESLASKDDAGAFVDVWELVTDRGQRDQAEQIIARLVDGDAEPVLKKRTPENYAAMFSLLGRIGDEKSLKEIRDRVFKRSLDAGMTASPELAAAALRAMCNWPDGRVADDLLAVAGNTDFSDGDRIAALRGFTRVASLPWDRIKLQINDKQKSELLAKGMPLALRVDEKRLIVQRMGQIRDLESLKFVLKYFDDPELQDQVCRSIVDLAHHNDLRRRDKDAFGAALEKVMNTSKDQGLVNRAKQYKENM